MCRDRQVPAELRRRDVPELSGDARGAALHARAGSPALGDAAGRSRHRWLAVDRGARRAGPVPVVQGMPVGLPGQRRHGNVQSRIHSPPLRPPALGAAAVALVDGLAAAVVAVRLAGAAAGQPDGAAAADEDDWAGSRPEREIPVFAEQTFTSWFAGRSRQPDGCDTGARSCCGPTPSPITWHPRSGGRRSRCWRPPGIEVVLPDKPGVLRADLDLHRPAASGADGASSARWRSWRRSWPPARRSSGWSRVAPRCCGTTRPSCCRTTRLPPRRQQSTLPSPSS